MSKSESTRGTGAGPADGAGAPRGRGRPRREINIDAVADAVAQIFLESGFEAVSIPAAAEKLSVSRATLYRTVPTKEDLLGILFERSTREMSNEAQKIIDNGDNAGARLRQLVRMQISSAIRMREYLPVFFGDMGMPPEVYQRWRTWSRDYEQKWTGVVSEAMEQGVIDKADPVITTRLMFGMCLWVSRWYRSAEPYSAEEISDVAVRLVLGQ